MPREVKQDRRTEAEVAPSAPSLRAEPAALPHAEARSFPAFDPETPPPLAAPSPAPRVDHALTIALGVAALLSAALPTIPALRLLLPAALAIAAVVTFRRARRRAEEAAALPPPVPAPPRRRRALRLDGARVVFAGAATETLIDLGAPFGVTLLASPRRDRLVVLLSSISGTYYVGAAVDEPARQAVASLLDHALTVADDDAALSAIGPDGAPLLLAPADLAALVGALAEHSPACLDRVILTDARGASLTLDGRNLSIGDRVVDLTAPLSWRSIVFQEAFGQVVAVYQGTWVCQGGTEVVLVSLLPALGPPPGSEFDVGELDRGALRDLRLMAASPEDPPPVEQRVAIDRPFMLPLRSALDRAPRASRRPDRAQA